MRHQEVTDKNERLNGLIRTAEEAEGTDRRPRGRSRFMVPVAWSLFQGAAAWFGMEDTTSLKAIHLAFALVIVFFTHRPFNNPPLP